MAFSPVYIPAPVSRNPRQRINRRPPPRGCREFSLPVSYPETWRNRSTYCLELIFPPPSFLPSFFVRGNFPPLFRPIFFLLSTFFFSLPLPLPLPSSKSFGLFSVEAMHIPSLERLGFQEKRRGWRPGDEWWREFGKRGQVARPGLINGVDRIAC